MTNEITPNPDSNEDKGMSKFRMIPWAKVAGGVGVVLATAVTFAVLKGKTSTDMTIPTTEV